MQFERQVRAIGIAALLCGAACSKPPEPPPATSAAPPPIEVPASIRVEGLVPEDLLPLPALDPAFHAAARAAYVEFAGHLDAQAFLASFAEIGRALSSGTREQGLNAVRMCGASRDLRAIPLLVRELARPDREYQVWVAVALAEIVDNHEFERRDPARPEAVHLLPRKEGDVDLRPLRWVLEEMLRSGEPNLQARAATMGGYLGLDGLAPLLRALRASRHPAVTNAVDHALGQLALDAPR